MVRGVASVVRGLQRHVADAGLAEVACTTIGILTIFSQTAEPVLAAGGLEALVCAMETHADDAAVQQEACEAVASLLSQSDAVVLDGSAVGCVRAVVRALQDHAAVEGVCRQGCWALGTLALDSNNEAEAVEAGAIEAVVVRFGFSFVLPLFYSFKPARLHLHHAL